MYFKFYKPKFWDKRYISIYSIILLPLTLLYIFLFNIKKKITKTVKHNLNIICVGNIYLGGTGKTPLALKIVKKLNKYKIDSVIIKKERPQHIDEINLIKANCNNVLTAKIRNEALQIAANNFKVAVLDDGLQDFSFKKNIKIICFSGSNGIGNKMQIPSGPLRENFKNVMDSDFIFITGEKNKHFETQLKNMNYDQKHIFFSNYQLINAEKYINKKILAFAGIGQPKNFYNLLKKNGIMIEQTLSFPDHYNYSQNDIKKIKNLAALNNLMIVTTEKDYYRIHDKKFINDINYVKIDLNIDNENLFFKLLYKKLNENF